MALADHSRVAFADVCHSHLAPDTGVLTGTITSTNCTATLQPPRSHAGDAARGRACSYFDENPVDDSGIVPWPYMLRTTSSLGAVNWASIRGASDTATCTTTTAGRQLSSGLLARGTDVAQCHLHRVASE